ncbi:Uncharacterised protein [Klebsiella oxytoca]|nr:Uncharacterised protein [Klebsiella oxytoca]
MHQGMQIIFIAEHGDDMLDKVDMRVAAGSRKTQNHPHK